MPIISVDGGVLYQWDTGRKIRVDPPVGETVSEVHFSYARSSTALVVYPKTEDGVITAKIPNEILQHYGAFIVYAVMVTEDGSRTMHSRGFSVVGRAQPRDYDGEEGPEGDDGGGGETVSDEYIESVVFDALNRWDLLDALVDGDGTYLLDENGVALLEDETTEADETVKLDEEQIQVAVDKYLDEHLIDIGVDEEELNQAVEAALNEAKASGMFDGKDGQNGRDGSDGVSATHEWNGTTLTMTSASGTSSADLKGEKGDAGYTPQKGVDYFDGKDGADGEPGKDGYTPQKGVDYFDGKDGAAGVNGTGVKRINTKIRSFTSAEWQQYGAIDRAEGWSYDSSEYDNSHISVGDTAYIVGTASDALDINGKPVGAAIYGVVTEVSDTHVKMASSYLLMGYVGASPDTQTIVDAVLAALPAWTGGSY